MKYVLLYNAKCSRCVWLQIERDTGNAFLGVLYWGAVERKLICPKMGEFLDAHMKTPV